MLYEIYYQLLTDKYPTEQAFATEKDKSQEGFWDF